MTEHHRLQKNHRTALARGDHAAEIQAALLGDAKTTALNGAGRGAVESFTISGGEGVLRKCRRGGLIGKMVHEGYVLRNRPLAEFRVHEHLFDAGVAVPEPLGVMWERRGPIVRGAIATRKLGAVGLADWLAQQSSATASVLETAGRLIRAMHDAGVFHADLHVENLLVSEDGNVFLIDFDNASLSSRVGTLQRARNLLRLRRSFLKRRLPLEHYNAMLAGYGPIAIPSWLDAAYRIKGKASDLLAAW